MADKDHIKALNEIDHCAMTGEECFSKAHGIDIWPFMTQNPGYSRIFQSAMTGYSQSVQGSIVEGVDFKRFATICDVAGGRGELLAAAVRAAGPSTRGVLFELPAVVAAKDEVLACLGDTKDRVTIVGGDMFKEIPSGNDAVLFKHIMHDWSDEKCIEFLNVARISLNKGGRILVFEHVIQDLNVPDGAKILDLEMLTVTNGGRERVGQEYAQLFAAAGLKLVSITPLKGPLSAIEAMVSSL